MNSNDNSADQHAGGLGSDSFVLLAKAMVASAIGCGMYLQLGASMAISAGTALAAYFALVVLHILRARQLSNAENSHGEPTHRDTAEQDAAYIAHDGHQQQRGAEMSAPPRMRSDTLSAAPHNPPPVPAAQRSQMPAVARAPARHVDPVDPSDDYLGHTAIQEFWAYRPTEETEQLPIPQAAPTVQPARPLAPPQTHRAQQPAERTAATLREADVEMIQGLIKKLADEVNAAETGPAAGHPARATANPARQAAAVETSLEALRVTAGTMRQAAARTAQHAHAEMRPAVPVPVAPPPMHPGHYRLAAIAEAVHSGRVDVMLEPIMGLGDLRARHYEVSLRLFDPTGAGVTYDLEDAALAGTNLLPLLDRTQLDRTSSVAKRLDERGKTGAVFSDFSGEALTDRGFITDAADDCRQHVTLAGQLVLTFAQNDIRMMTPAQWRGLNDLRSLGFRFALGGVTDLDMDFERLAAIGFAFVKLDADVFLDGLPSSNGTVPSNDICGYLASLGFTLIAGRIDSEYERARLYGFGVLFGQGELFGGARPMKANALAGSRQAA